jgi:uncharacterized repeat protein (TIGR01451 family)
MVADPEALTNITILPAVGLVQTDPLSGQVFYVVQNGSGWSLVAFDMSTLMPVWAYPVPGAVGNADSLTKCGPGILAFKTDYDQIFILNTPNLPHVLQTDLSVTETASSTSTTTNLPITFFTMVWNNGPAPTVNLVITNQLPPDAIIQSITCSQGTVTNSANQILCYAGNLQVGQYAWLQVIASLGHAGTLTNFASAGGNSSDSVATNNMAVATTTFGVIPVSDLAVSQLLPPAPATVGSSNVVYTLTITNGGPNSSTNVYLNDNFPSGAMVVSVTASQSSEVIRQIFL